MSSEDRDLSIGEVAKATGLTEATLRAWERRFGFPSPARQASGHRRYSTREVELIGRVVDQRSRGVALARAIELVRSTPPSGRTSFFAPLRERHPELSPIRAKKSLLVAFSRAIEDESAARAERSLLIGGFQQERFYRASEGRWRDLSRETSHTLVFADFAVAAQPEGGPVELPLGERDPARREWVLISSAPEHGVCLIAWEPPGRRPGEDGRREFETLYSLRPEVIRSAARTALALLARSAPEEAELIEAQTAWIADPSPESQLDLSAGITARMLETLSR